MRLMNACSNSVFPHRFFFPITGEPHRSRIHAGEVGKKRLELSGHIVVRRNDVDEEFNDAEVEIDTTRVGRRFDPRG